MYFFTRINPIRIITIGIIKPYGKGIIIMKGIAATNPPITNTIPTINDVILISLPKILAT